MLPSAAIRGNGMNAVRLYHTGFQVIEKPDIHYGRKNADFGQGFYLSDDGEFSKRWAKQRKGTETFLNRYELVADRLKIKRFTRDEEWFSYIFDNRAGREDRLKEYDVIVGPIANDTLYDTWGVITSGFFEPTLGLELLRIGPMYEQTVIKTEKALAQLRFIGAEKLSVSEIAAYRQVVAQEEKAFQKQFAERLSREPGFADEDEPDEQRST